MTALIWGIVCVAAGAAFLVNAAALRRARVRFLRSAVPAVAIVVAARVEGVGRNAVSIPTLEFTAADGTIHWTETLQPSGFAGGRVGESVRIRYDPLEPQRADLDGFWPLWGLVLLRAGFGAVFALMGVTALLIAAF